MSSDESAIEFDESDFPLLKVRFKREPTNQEFTAYLDRYQTYLHGNRRFAAVFVTEPGLPMTKTRHARQQADFIQKNKEQMAARVGGVAFVLPTAVMRGVLRAILSWQAMPCDYKVFDDEKEATEWAGSKLEHR